MQLFAWRKGLVSSGVMHIGWLLFLVSSFTQLTWWIQQIFFFQVSISLFFLKMVNFSQWFYSYLIFTFQSFHTIPYGIYRLGFLMTKVVISTLLVFLHCFADKNQESYQNLASSEVEFYGTLFPFNT